MAVHKKGQYPRRIYPLSPRDLTEEQLAVTFAMTSRRPEPFDEIATMVSQEKAADFHERWVLGYGHASVAEHAVIHMALENISRLACDSIEDNRLGSYTEKSSRYQILPQGYYYFPEELTKTPKIAKVYVETCESLFSIYEDLTNRTLEYLFQTRHRNENERESAYNVRLRREAIDTCRFILPSATLTNVGVTMNARVMEHAISKLLSSELLEEQSLGEQIKQEGKNITPTLIKYADKNEYMFGLQSGQTISYDYAGSIGYPDLEAMLVYFDDQAYVKLATALLYRYSEMPYVKLLEYVQSMDSEDRHKIIHDSLVGLGPHDAPPREFELVEYTFDLVMDYGAYREFKRHRMQTYVSQPLTIHNGFLMPPLMEESDLKALFHKAIETSENGFGILKDIHPNVAQYLVTHAHKRRVLSKINLRECYHLFKMRTQPQAHFSIRGPILEAMRLAVEVHPELFRYIKLRQKPDWWHNYY